MSFLAASARSVFRAPGVTFCRFIVAKYSVSCDIKERIDEIVKDKPVVVFMKGTPEEPRCGFSKAVVQILNFHGVDKFDSFDVLEDEDVRKGIKDYTEWPTIPQVFFNGEFVGGCDIMIDMHRSGELIEELKKVGIRSALLDKKDR